MMYTPLLLTLLAVTALALPRPQSLVASLPSTDIPNNTSGCTNIIPCNDWLPQVWERATARKKAEKEKNEHSLTVRDESDDDVAGVFYCTDAGWRGECTYRSTPLGSDPANCTVLDPVVSSVGPDKGFFCIFYTNAFCAPLASDGSDALTLSYPGLGDLAMTPKGDLSDRLRSYQCFREEKVGLAPLEG